jgi:translation initiation factor IF-2
MKVSELAKEYGLKSEDILLELKTLKLKSKDAKQDLSPAAIAVLRRSLEAKGRKIVPVQKEEKPVAPKVQKEKSEKPEPKSEKKTLKPLSSKVKKIAETKEKPKAVKKVVIKKVSSKAKKEKPQEVKAEKGKASVVPKGKVVKAPEAEKVKKAVEPLVQKEVKKEPSKVSGEKQIISVKPEPPKVNVVAAKPVEYKKDRFTPSHPQRYDRRSHVPHRPQVSLASASLVDRPLKEIELTFPISVKDLSIKLQQKPSAVLKTLMQKGMLATINQSLNEEIVSSLQGDLNFSYKKMKTEEEQLVALRTDQGDPGLKRARPPVITFMGHVDHGKTSLLDSIRKSHIVDKEHGGITQHMAAYSVVTPRGKITFLDTPGHAAFTAMRARGAHITDLIILVVAADEGVMPQTEEAIGHARAAGVPIVVAINKIDKRNINIDRVKKQLAQNDVNPEDWGGKTITLGVSATTGEGVDHLLEMILLEAELLDLKANYDRPATGIVVEAHLSHGRGSVASIIVQSGTLKDGDIVVAGPYFGKVKAMFGDYGKEVKVAEPATPVEILGLSGIPEAGEIFYVVPDEKNAREVCEARSEQIKSKRLESNQKITLEGLYAQIQQGKIKDLNIVLKTDVQGSMEALRESLQNLSNNEVQIKFIHTGIGDINAADVILAQVSAAIIVGFHVQISSKAAEELAKQNVDVRMYRIIYDAVDDIKKALSGLLEPKIRKKFIGRVEIRQVFKLSKSGVVAGCFVLKGRIDRKSKITIMRNGEEVFAGEIDSLKRFKDDVREVKEGFECGITLRGFDGIAPGDLIEAYELETIQREL